VLAILDRSTTHHPSGRVGPSRDSFLGHVAQKNRRITFEAGVAGCGARNARSRAAPRCGAGARSDLRDPSER
jgi:hypothetical protein